MHCKNAPYKVLLNTGVALNMMVRITSLT